MGSLFVYTLNVESVTVKLLYWKGINLYLMDNQQRLAYPINGVETKVKFKYAFLS